MAFHPTHRPARRGARRGFTLLEVMIALSVLVVSLAILIDIQTASAENTFEAERFITATQLAQEKMTEVRLLVEREGFPDSDLHDQGDFDDFGDEALDIEMADLDQFHWEYLVTETDLGMGGDLSSLMTNLSSTFGGGEAGSDATAAPADLSALGISPDFLEQLITPYLREVRIRVYWGEDMDEAEEMGTEVTLTSYVINPQGNILGNAGLAAGSGTSSGTNNAASGATRRGAGNAGNVTRGSGVRSRPTTPTVGGRR